MFRMMVQPLPTHADNKGKHSWWLLSAIMRAARRMILTRNPQEGRANDALFD